VNARHGRIPARIISPNSSTDLGLRRELDRVADWLLAVFINFDNPPARYATNFVYPIRTAKEE